MTTPSSRSSTISGKGRGTVRNLLLLPFLLLACRDDDSSGGFTREQYRAGATALFQQQLYQESIDLYRAYLASPTIPPEDVSKVLYQIGVIYQDNLKQPQSALAQYTLVKTLFPDQAFAPDLGKRMVACLEASGRSSEAGQALSSLTKLPGDSSRSEGDGTVLAEVEGRKITAGEVAAAMGGKLPGAPVEQAQAVRQYVGQILLAQSARRRGLAEQSDVKRVLDLMETQILAQAALREEIKVPAPQANDLRYYYEANKARYQHGPDSGSGFEKLEPKVRADWAREKQSAAAMEFVEKLLQASKVRFYGNGP
jgi:tetratricopeptide (TPR) repeat protein